jgi:aldehyde:ferredoxin oxidoreductase
LPLVFRFNAQNSTFRLTISLVAEGNEIGGETMDEKSLLELWNTKRSQVINAQIAPTLMLVGVFVLAAYGKFETATDAAKYLTIGVAAATGILAIISQYATIREAEILLVDLKRIEKPSELSKKIANSRGLLSLSAIAMVGLGIAVFALVVWAVLG